jgi:hypothetical protein
LNGLENVFHFLTGLYFPPLVEQDLAPFCIRRLLAFLRARLSTLLYKSIKRTCLFDFDTQTYKVISWFPNISNKFSAGIGLTVVCKLRVMAADQRVIEIELVWARG